MTRIFTDGAEMGDTQFWDYVSSPLYIYATTTPVPIGGEWSYHGAYLSAFKVISDLSEFYLRYRLRFGASLTNAQRTPVLGWRKGNTAIGCLALDDINRLCFYRGSPDPFSGVMVATSNIVVQVDTWYLIEIHVSLDNAAGRYELFVDGNQVVDYTGDTMPGADATVDNIYWSSGIYAHIYIDDLALNDTNGIVDNTWCGDGIIMKMIPDGNGAHNNWTNSDGDSVNNYLYVDEYPNDGDLTYVYRDGTDTGSQDQYTLSDLDYTNKTVLRIYPEARARKTSAVGFTLKLGILPNGGVDDVSAGSILFEDYYARIVGDDYLTNPLDADIWEEVDLDSLQVILEVG